MAQLCARDGCVFTAGRRMSYRAGSLCRAGLASVNTTCRSPIIVKRLRMTAATNEGSNAAWRTLTAATNEGSNAAWRTLTAPHHFQRARRASSTSSWRGGKLLGRQAGDQIARHRCQLPSQARLHQCKADAGGAAEHVQPAPPATARTEPSAEENREQAAGGAAEHTPPAVLGNL